MHSTYTGILRSLDVQNAMDTPMNIASTLPQACYSVERLIRMALRVNLIEDYRVTSGQIQLFLSDGRQEFGPEEARAFLYGMLYGYQQAGRDLLRKCAMFD